MKLLPKVYKSVTGEPFRVETYHDAKIEMYYLDETQYLSRFASKGKFAVWTSDGVDYRLLIEKGYYEAIPDLYQADINVIWLDFMNYAYQTQTKLSRKYSLFTLITFVLSLASVFLITELSGQDTVGFVVGIAILFVGLFTFSKKQQNELRTYIKTENVTATQKIKDTLGENRFEELLNEQQAYYEKYFAFDDEEEAVELDQPAEELEAEITEVEQEETGDK